MTERWYERAFVVLDFESTAPDPQVARPVSVTCGWVGAGVQDLTSCLINPGVDIPAEAQAIHGISTERARTEGRDPVDVVTLVGAILHAAWAEGEPVVAFNACYDLTLLDRELRRHGLPGLESCVGPVVDPMVISRWATPELKGAGLHKLEAVCARYGVPHGGAHDAREDALAAGRLAWKMPRALAGIADMSLSELHRSQAGWHARNQRDLRRFWERKGDPRAAEVDGSWPIRPLCCECHQPAGCCDPNDCGPCCERCPTCPTLAKARA